MNLAVHPRRAARRVRRRLLRRALAGTTARQRRVLASAWGRPVRLRLLVQLADADGLRALVDAAPEAGRDVPEVRLVQSLVPGSDPVDPRALGRNAAQVGDAVLRKEVARRLADTGQAERALAVLDATPRVELDDRRMVLVVRNLRDPETLDRLIERTSARLAEPRPGKRLVRLHREALITRGRIPYRAWRAEEALHWFDRAHAETGPMMRTWTWRGKALRRLGRLDEARVSGEAALKERPDWVPALVHLGNLYHQLGDRSASVDCWRRVLDVPKVTVDHLERTWTGLVRVRELELGLRAAERLVAATRGAPLARARFAAALWELGRHDEAEDAITDLRDRTDADHVLGLAWFLGRTGDAAAAHELLRRLPMAQVGAHAAEELYHMLRRDGHLGLAAEWAHDAAEAFPDDHDLRKVHDEIEAEVRVFRGTWRAPVRSVPALTPVSGRILHVVGRSVPYAWSGYCVRTDHTVRAQRAAGLDVHVATQLGFPWEEGRDAPLEETVGGVPHHRLPIPDDARVPMVLTERLERHVDALGDLVERLRPTVLHAASDFRNALVALEVGGRYDLPVVYEMRGFWEETWLAKRRDDAIDSDMYRWRRERETEAAARATHVFTLAPTMRDDLVARGIDPEKISLAPNAVSPDAFTALPRDDELASELGITPGEVVVGYISSFTGYEGIHVLIDAVARLRRDGAPVKCLLVGDGEVSPELERQARELGLVDAVVFTGRVPHDTIGSYYGLIDVFVVPRTRARVCRLVSPLKPYEAMAAGRAVVLSGTPVLSTIVEEGVTGVTFEPEDPDDLAARIGQLAADRDLRERLGAAARRHVLAQHTWHRNVERYLEVYRRLGIASAPTTVNSSSMER